MSESDMIKVLWDDPSPDLRLMRAIQALIDASATTLADEDTAAILAYLLAKYQRSSEPLV